MSLTLATFLARLAAAYLLVGGGFAVAFAARWAGRLDPAAASGTLGFRLLLLPGAALLWPYLAVKLARRRAGARP